MPQPGGQWRDQYRLLRIQRRDAHHAFGLLRREGARRPQHAAQRLHGAGDRLFQRQGNGGGFHAMRPAQEQLILEHVAQPPQGLADRRGRETEFGCHGGRPAVPQQAEEHQQQGKVKPPEFSVSEF